MSDLSDYLSKDLLDILSSPQWEAIGQRIKGYRLVKGWTEDEFAQKLGIDTGTLKNIEKGKEFKTLNNLWNIIHVEQISINWLFKGVGEYNSADPPSLLPPTLIHKKGAGLKRTESRRSAEEGCFIDETFEFVMAVDAYKTLNKKRYPTWTEIYELFIGLGYRKVAPATINPKTGVKL